MERHYPVHQRMALPSSKPPRAPNQRTTLPSIGNQFPIKAEVQIEINPTFNRSGRDPIRRKKPVPMPRTIKENAIDVPPEFEMAAYSRPPPKKINNNVVAMTGYQHQSSPTRPKSMMESISKRESYRVGNTYILYSLFMDSLGQLTAMPRISIATYRHHNLFSTPNDRRAF